MNNPDEQTAVEQFGKEGKYFGASVLLVTMPGLPMFGHGQIEGFHEKYGMEYRRAYWDEPVDQHMVSAARGTTSSRSCAGAGSSADPSSSSSTISLPAAT